MATPAQAIASLKAKMEGIVLDQVNYRMALTADRLALRIKSRIKLDLQSFFVTMVQDHFGEENEPAWSYDYSNPSWSKLSTEYVRKKKAGRIDYFVYSELPKVLSRAARKKTKTVGGFKRSNVSLRRVLSAISNPERIFGPVKVTVQSSIGINKAGKRYYLAGTTLDGVKAGGRLVKDGKDIVSIVVDWAPKFEGKNVNQRGVVEASMPRAGGLRQKLLNREGSYRPLIGPRMLWYQEMRVTEIIQQAIDGKGMK